MNENKTAITRTHNHGLSGYIYWKCRCDICKSAVLDYRASPKSKLAHARYDSSPEGKLVRAKYRNSPNGKRMYSMAETKRYSTAEGKQKQKSRSVLRYRLKTGDMTRQSCLICDQGLAEAHHWRGYEDKYACDVIWLCVLHHKD